MPKIEAFEKYTKEYDEWFIKNEHIYLAELNAIKELIPVGKYGMEIGVGTGRFALPLGIKVGVEPSKKMAELSRSRGIEVYEGTAENLPFDNNTFDFVLMVTIICFVDDVLKSLNEAYRVLKNNGFIIIGFIEKESEIGRQYQIKKEKSKFYKDAVFYSTEEVIELLKKAGFGNFKIKQTVFSLDNKQIDKAEDGYGKGSFIVVKGMKINK